MSVYQTQRSGRLAIRCDGPTCKRRFHPQGFISSIKTLRARAAAQDWIVTEYLGRKKKGGGDFCSLACKIVAGKT